MGWWSADILGGDTPLDNLLLLEEIVGKLDNWKCKKSKTKINKKSVLNWMNTGYDKSIKAQLTAELFLANNIKVTKKEKSEIIKLIKQDDWYCDAMKEDCLTEYDTKRIKVITDLIERFQ